MRSALLFLIGLLIGANLVYFWMSRTPGACPAPTQEAIEAAPPAGTAAPPATPATPPGPAAPGALLVPVEGIEPAQLADTFMDPRGEDRSHQALDIAAPAGTPVRAVTDGRVARLFESAAGGITIYQFDPAEEYAYYYAHLEGYAAGLEEGQALRRGQVIGYVGSSGNADPSAPHLHFAVYRLGPDKRWHNGTPVNPYPLLRGEAGSAG